MKRYSIQYNIGKAKYVVSFHDGEKKHNDGGDFFGIRIFSNKIKMSCFVNYLNSQGYKTN